jgi:ADP-heptose:LPS heptosyltransferase
MRKSLLKRLRRLLKPLYQTRWLPFVRATLTHAFRLAVLLARSVGIIRPASASAPESFLIINLAGHLGDTIMLIPILEALRAAHPHARIELAVEAAAAPILRPLDILDQVHAFRLGSIPPTTLRLAFARTLAVIRLWWPIRRQLRPTTTIVPRWGDDLFRSSTLAYLIHGPIRIGFAANVDPDRPPATYRDHLFTQLAHGGSNTSEAMKYLSLILQTGLIPSIPDLRLLLQMHSPALQRAAAQPDWPALAALFRIPLDAPFAVIAPGASMPRRIYPVELWLPVIAALTQRGIPTVLLGGPADAATAQALHAFAPSTILSAGTTTLLESAAILAHAKLFLGNDSGPAHLAAALGIPTTVLYIADPTCNPNHPATPERVAPFGPHVTILRPANCLPPCIGACSAPEAHCLRTIAPAEITAAVLSFLIPDP